MSENKITLEERFSHISDILEKMETKDVSLDESFELYKQGISEIKACNEMIDSVEKAMLVLNQNGELEEF